MNMALKNEELAIKETTIEQTALIEYSPKLELVSSSHNEMEFCEIFDLIDRQEIENKEIRNLEFVAMMIKNSIFSHVKFVNCNFFAVEMQNCLFDNCLFENCRFSFTHMRENIAENCNLVDCGQYCSSLSL